MSINNAQKAVIHVAKAQLHMADEDYRSLLGRCAGVSSSMGLDEAGFLAVMAEFERLGFRKTMGRAQTFVREGMASPAQIGKIRALWKGWAGEDDEIHLGRWLHRTVHVSHVNFLSAERAGKAIAILAKMNRHPNAKRPVGSGRGKRYEENSPSN